MPNVLTIQGNVDDGLRMLLRSLLETEEVEAIFGLRLIGDGAVSYSLVTDISLIDSVVPFFPLMPVQGGQALSRMTLSGPFPARVAAILRPCEHRALMELVKRKQASVENLLVISCTCPGVYPLSASLNGGLGSVMDTYREAVARNAIPDGIRSACASCIEFLPHNADMTVLHLGCDSTQHGTQIILNTTLAENLALKVKGHVSETEDPGPSLEGMQNERRENRARLFEEVKNDHWGLQGLTELFSRCLGCRGCREVCPICYCDLCEFDSRRSDLTIEALDAALGKRGGLRLPTGILAFHLGRLTHMGMSCVACGQCSDVCPVDIPVATIFSKVGRGIQEMFEYLPGRDVEEALPLTTFQTEELADVED